MEFQGYDAIRERHPDTGFILVDKRKTADAFPGYVANGQKLGEKDIYVHRDDLGKTY